MTTSIDVQKLLEPISADRFCGADPEGSPALAALEKLELFGRAKALDPPPPWGEVKERALEALAESKDLRLLTYLGAAVLRTDGVQGFCDVLTIASGWLDRYWADVYPALDGDGVHRRNVLSGFGDQFAIIEALRRAPIVASPRHGRFGLRDVELATGQITGGAPPESASLDAAFAEMPASEADTLQTAVRAALDALAAVDALMRDRIGAGGSPSLEALQAQLSRIGAVLRTRVPTRAGGEQPDDGRDSFDGPPTPGSIGAVRSREDAVRAMETVAEFFRRTEPSSPIPLLLDRARRLVAKGFLEVLADIAPDAVGQARNAGGLKDGQ